MSGFSQVIVSLLQSDQGIMLPNFGGLLARWWELADCGCALALGVHRMDRVRRDRQITAILRNEADQLVEEEVDTERIKFENQWWTNHSSFSRITFFSRITQLFRNNSLLPENHFSGITDLFQNN
jgi:hypothetical protein